MAFIWTTTLLSVFSLSVRLAWLRRLAVAFQSGKRWVHCATLPQLLDLTLVQIGQLSLMQNDWIDTEWLDSIQNDWIDTEWLDSIQNDWIDTEWLDSIQNDWIDTEWLDSIQNDWIDTEWLDSIQNDWIDTEWLDSIQNDWIDTEWLDSIQNDWIDTEWLDSIQNDWIDTEWLDSIQNDWIDTEWLDSIQNDWIDTEWLDSIQNDWIDTEWLDSIQNDWIDTEWLDSIQNDWIDTEWLDSIQNDWIDTEWLDSIQNDWIDTEWLDSIQNGWIWYRMIRFDTEWFRFDVEGLGFIHNDWIWYRIIGIDIKWIFRYDTECLKLIQNCQILTRLTPWQVTSYNFDHFIFTVMVVFFLVSSSPGSICTYGQHPWTQYEHAVDEHQQYVHGELDTIVGPVPIRHRSHDFATQSSLSVDRAGWQAKMASIEFWIPWRSAHKPQFTQWNWCDRACSHIRARVRIHTDTHTHTHTHARTRTHTHTHLCMHTHLSHLSHTFSPLSSPHCSMSMSMLRLSGIITGLLLVHFQLQNESRTSELLAAACAVGVSSNFAAPIGGRLQCAVYMFMWFCVNILLAFLLVFWP